MPLGVLDVRIVDSVALPILVLAPGIGGEISLWPPATISIDLLFRGAFFLLVRREAWGQGNEAALTMLGLDAIASIAGFGLAFPPSFSIVLVPDALFGRFFYALSLCYRPGPAGPPVGAT